MAEQQQPAGPAGLTECAGELARTRAVLSELVTRYEYLTNIVEQVLSGPQVVAKSSLDDQDPNVLAYFEKLDAVCPVAVRVFRERHPLVTVTLDVIPLIVLLTHLRLSLRHPAIGGTGPSIVAEFVQRMQRTLVSISPELEKLLKADELVLGLPAPVAGD